MDFLGLATKTCRIVSAHSDTIDHQARLEHVKALVLHHLPIVLEKVHTELQMLASIHIYVHDVIVCSIQQYLSQELDGLSLRDVGVGLHERVVVFCEEKIEVHHEVMGNDSFVFGQEFLESSMINQ